MGYRGTTALLYGVAPAVQMCETSLRTRPFPVAISITDTAVLLRFDQDRSPTAVAHVEAASPHQQAAQPSADPQRILGLISNLYLWGEAPGKQGLPASNQREF